MLKCVDCGTEFERQSTRGKTPTLCPECKARRRRARTNNWHRANPEKVRKHKKRKPPIVTLVCIGCGQEFPRPGTFGPVRTRCPECKVSHLQTQRRLAVRRKRLALYGITAEQYDEMMAKQDGACAICRLADWGPHGPHIDHDHATGAVRGLLCQPCNQAIGQLRDDPEIIRAAADYVEQGGSVGGYSYPGHRETMVMP